MDIRFFNAAEIDASLNIKATVHLSGRLGFNLNASNKLELDERKYVKIGYRENFKVDGFLYLVINNNNDDESFSVSKAGEYYYINTKNLFDYLNVDYQRSKIVYEITELKENKGIYQLKPKIKERKKNEIENE